MSNEPLAISFLGEGAVVHSPRKQDRVCAACGHPEYCHNPEVPPTFPYDPTDLCIGFMENWTKGSGHGKRFMSPDPERLKVWMAAGDRLRRGHGQDPETIKSVHDRWNAFFAGGIGALVCSCRAFVLKEVKSAPAPLQDVQSS